MDLTEIKDFIEGEIIPCELRWINAPFFSIVDELNRYREKVKANGWWLPQMDSQYGGQGMPPIAHAQLMEILGRTPYGCYLFNTHAPDTGNMELLHMAGTPAQKEKYLIPLANGDIRSCFSMTEPDRAGSNPTQMDTRAERKGDRYVINGKKWFTTAADGADFAIVMAVTNPDAVNPYERSSMIIVPTHTEGFSISRNISIMGHEGEGWHSHSEIIYDQVEVPVSNLLGEEGHGFLLAQKRLGPGRIHHCMRWIGICERAFEMMCRRAKSRAFSDTECLGDKQMIQDFIATSRADIDAAKLLVMDTTEKIHTLGYKAARNQISAIKFHTASVLQKVIDRAIQTHGALGITDDLILSYFYREERGARIYDGPDEAHKAALAKQILKTF